MRFHVSDYGFRFPFRKRPLLAIVAALLVAMHVGAANVNGYGVSVSLPAADLWPGTAQTNAAGTRLVSAGTPALGIVSANAVGTRIIIEPMNALAANGSSSGAPAADFNADPPAGDAPLEVQFTDLSTGGLYEILAWSWDFGDGSPLSSEPNPVHVYDNPGTYDVTLTIMTALDIAAVTETGFITVTQTVPAMNWAGMLLVAAFLMIAGLKAQQRLNNRYSPGASSGHRFGKGSAPVG